MICLFMASFSIAQTPKEKGLEAITMESIKAQLEFLSSDWTEGRETGTRGIFMAGDYVASMFKYAGVQPGGDLMRSFARRGRNMGSSAPQRSYFQNFTLVETLPGGESSLKVTNGGRAYSFVDRVDFSIPRASASAEVSGNVVFVGYGIESDELGIHDLKGADLNGKVILKIAGFPGMNDQNSAIYKKLMEDRYAAYRIMRDVNNKIVEMGAAAIIEVTPGANMGNNLGVFVDDMNMSPNEGRSNPDFTRLRMDTDELSSAPLQVSVTEKVIKAILQGSDVNLEGYIASVNAGNSKFKPIELKGVKVDVTTEVKKRRVNVRNVVAMIEGKKKDEYVVVGGHMDHMGMSGGRIWNGADDNASGTVGVMTLAKAFAATGVQPERTVIFCAWTGEEKGLLGSTYFANNPTFGTKENCKFYLNYDMISRDAANDEEGVNVGVTYNSNFPALKEIQEKNVEEYGLKMSFNYRGQENPTGGSDYTAFTQNGVPIIAVMAAMHPEYHTPADHVELVNWEKMLEIIKLGFLTTWDIANSDF